MTQGYRVLSIQAAGVFSFMRIKDWWYLLGIYALGVLGCPPDFLSVPQAVWGAGCAVCYLASGYMLNEYYDRQSIPVKGRFLLKGLVYFLPFVNVLAAYILLPRPAAPILIMGTAVSWVYSAPPFYLKRNAWWRLALNGMGFAFVYLLGCAATRCFRPGVLFVFLYVVFLFIAIELIHNLNDAEEDAATRVRSFVLRFGVKRTWFMLIGILGFLSLWGVIGVYLSFMGVFLLLLTFFLAIALIIITGRYVSLYGTSLVRYKGVKRQSRFILSIFGSLWFIISVADAGRSRSREEDSRKAPYSISCEENSVVSVRRYP